MVTITKKTSQYNFDVVNDASYTLFYVHADEGSANIEFIDDILNFVGTPKEVAKYMRKLADQLVSIAGKVEAIK